MRSFDAVSGYGEKLSAPIVAAAISARGHASVSVSAEELLLTTASHGNARVLVPASRVRTRDRLLPLIEGGIVPVVTGFIGATEDGATTTFGRHASLFGSHARRFAGCGRSVEVDGFRRYHERRSARGPPGQTAARALVCRGGGARIFWQQGAPPGGHPSGLEAGVPYRIVNSFNPDLPGTVLTNAIEVTPHAVKAVTAIRNQALVTVQGVGLSGVVGAAARVFGAVAQAKHERANDLRRHRPRATFVSSFPTRRSRRRKKR